MTNKYICLEGPDNSGKGTQIKLLNQNYKKNIFHTIHYSGLGFKKAEEHIEYSKKLYYDMFRLMVDSRGIRNFIFDRSHLGEMVYAPLYRNYNGDYVLDIEEVFTDTLKDELYLIVFINKPETIFKRDDGLSFYKNINEVRNEVNYFVDAYCKSKIQKKILIEVDDQTPEEIHKQVMEFIEN